MAIATQQNGLPPRAHAARIFQLHVRDWAKEIECLPEQFREPVRTHLTCWRMIAKAHANCAVTCRFCYPIDKDLRKVRYQYREMLRKRSINLSQQEQKR